MPVTKEEVAAEKARLKSIDSRPIKKVAEAKARKRMKLHARLTSAREKAEAIADQVDREAAGTVKFCYFNTCPSKILCSC